MITFRLLAFRFYEDNYNAEVFKHFLMPKNPHRQRIQRDPLWLLLNFVLNYELNL